MTRNVFGTKFLLLMVCLFALSLFGCRENDPIKDDTLLPDESMFVLSVSDTEESYAVGENILVTATFQNVSKTAFVIKHGAQFPIIALEDESITIIGVLIHETIRGQQEITTNRTFVFQEPGTYHIVVTARFKILSKDYSYTQEIQLRIE